MRSHKPTRRIRRPRRRRISRKHLTWAATILLFLAGLAVQGMRASPGQAQCSVPLVVSLTTTAGRIHTHFPTVFKSLVRQTASCLTLWVFVPLTDAAAMRAISDDLTAAALARKQAFVFFVPDRGPGTKYVYTLEALSWPEPSGWLPSDDNFLVLGTHPPGTIINAAWLRTQVLKLRAHRPLILVCDDDSWYPHSYVAAMLQGRERVPEAERGVTAGRGWRIRQDFTWGVTGEEYDFHVIDGWKVAAPYRVGVATANKGYLFEAAALAGVNVSDYALREALLVDDIWINGAWATAGAPRWVVPLVYSPVDMPAASLLDGRMQAAGVSRQAANNAVLQHFRREGGWETDILYQPGGKGGPLYKWSVRWWWWRVWRAGVAVRMALNLLE